MEDHEKDKHRVTRETAEVLLVVLIMLILYSFIGKWRKNGRKHIPGPWLRWPVLGNLPSFYRHSLHQKLSLSARVYGHIFMLRFSSHRVIVVNSYEAIQEVIARSKEFTYEPEMRPGKVVMCGGKIQCAVNNSNSKTYKRLCQSALRHLISRGKIKQILQHEMKEIVHEIHCQNSTPFYLEESIHLALINTAVSAVFGKRFQSRKDAEYMNISLLITALKEIDDSLEIEELLSEKEFQYALGEDLESKIGSLFDVYDKRLQQRLERHTDSEKSTSADTVLDSLLRARDRRVESKGSSSEAALLTTIHDLITDELVETLQLIQWCVYFLCKHPEYQVAIQEEIDAQGCISPYDATRIPYLQAAILETTRLACVRPLGIPHKASVETSLAGYRIPQDTLIVTNLWSMRRDPESFSEPEKFYPPRFLTSSGSLVLERAERVCPSRNHHSPEKKLAEMEVFFFIASILKEFSLQLVENQGLLDDFCDSSPVLPPYQITARPRGSANRKFLWDDTCYYHMAVLTQSFLLAE